MGVEFAGIRFLGLTSATGAKLGLTVLIAAGVLVVRFVLVAGVWAATRRPNSRALFWTRQGTSLAALVVLAIALTSVWFDDPARLTTVIGLATAGIAIAAQKAVTAFAGYLVIMRGSTFTVGDRIKMGGVQGDVIAMGFLQTRIMEMGQPNEVNEQEAPGMWVRARQFTGRIVTVTNDKIFDEPVYNFTQEYRFIWEELHIPIPYRADRDRAERILIDAVREATGRDRQAADAARRHITKKYGIELDTLEPRVYWTLTDNWLEMSVRFVVPDHGVRAIKDQINRTILREFDAAGLEIASATVDISSVPPLRVEPVATLSAPPGRA
jgi:small-conductance mechanosensitive channel